MLYSLILQLIISGRTDGLAEKLTVFYATGRLSGEQYAELSGKLTEGED